MVILKIIINWKDDGCSDKCEVEEYFYCENEPSVCDGKTFFLKYNKYTGICGDGLIKGSEQCDDANKLNGWSVYFNFNI